MVNGVRRNAGQGGWIDEGRRAANEADAQTFWYLPS